MLSEGGDKLNWVYKIQKAIDHIECNLTEKLSVDEVAKAVMYSPTPFQYLFSAVTGYSVGEYIRFRRLSCAADDLFDDKLSVTETAFKYQYETVEAFSKAFKKIYDVSPSKFTKIDSNYHKFAPINIKFNLSGGFSMAKNFIPNLLRVDWSDNQRQNEFVNSVVSALNALGEKLNYDYVCAVSGGAFRTSFSMTDWNHGNYHVINTPVMIEHVFKMLGYKIRRHIRGDYEFDKKLIVDSIEKGVPVITVEGVINCSDACVISGYDNDGEALLGYNPFMYINDDHNEPHDDTGYFRKSNWHGGYFEKSKGIIVIIESKGEKPSKEEIFAETLKLIKCLIADENIAPGQHNGLAAHKAFANALLNYEWEDNFEPYLNLMCNYKQYLDRQYAAKFFYDNGRADLAEHYEKITKLCRKLGEQIPQDFSAGDLFGDKKKLKPYCETLSQIADMENDALGLLDK